MKMNTTANTTLMTAYTTAKDLDKETEMKAASLEAALNLKAMEELKATEADERVKAAERVKADEERVKALIAARRLVMEADAGRTPTHKEIMAKAWSVVGLGLLVVGWLMAIGTAMVSTQLREQMTVLEQAATEANTRKVAAEEKMVAAEEKMAQLKLEMDAAQARASNAERFAAVAAAQLNTAAIQSAEAVRLSKEPSFWAKVWK